MPVCIHAKETPCPYCLAEECSWSGIMPGASAQKLVLCVGARSYTIEENYRVREEHGNRLWPAGFMLANRMARFGDLAGLSVLELGPGVGLAGLVASSLGAEVSFCESNSSTAERLKASLQINRLNAANWFTSPAEVKGKFDFIIASDVFHYSQICACLPGIIAETWTRGGICLFVDPRRKMAVVQQMEKALAPVCVFESRDKLRDGRVFACNLFVKGRSA